ncbi:MAG: DUF6605 domain-containing protein [Gaiellales bacterium]
MTLRFTVVACALGVAALVALRADAAPVLETPRTWLLEPLVSGRGIEGYTSKVSYAADEPVELHVSTEHGARYRIEVYRIGWYAGQGGELVACVPADCTADRDGEELPVPPRNDESGELRAGWPVTDVVALPSGARSGYYLARLVLTSGAQPGRVAGVPFVVRRPAGDHPDVLVVAPVNTWQAYNDWGGLSMYSDPRAATRVSFDRPYAPTLRKPYLDYPIVWFLDQFGYDVGYTTDADVDAARGQLADAKVVVVPAHSEYWSKELRDGLEAARGLGTSLAFLGGNTGYWQIRYADPERRVLELYRSASGDPNPNERQKTVRWRDVPVNRPECSLVGTQWQGGDDATEPGAHPYTVVASSLDHPWFAGTGFEAGDKVEGAVGYEWDSVAPECEGVVTPTVLFRWAGKQTPYPPGVYKSTFHSTDATMTTYTAESGARVLAGSSIELGWSIAGPAHGETPVDGVTDPEHPADPRMQRFVRNALDDMLGLNSR